MLAIHPQYEGFLRQCWTRGFKIQKIMELQANRPKLAHYTQKETLEAFKETLDNYFNYHLRIINGKT